jgi:peptide-methionine (S)-S-oxide reductase
MRTFVLAVMTAALLAGLPASTLASPPASAHANTAQHVVLAGGCFWGMQLVFESLKGVQSTVAGYSGGDAQNAQYERVSTGTTGHAESVEITYDPGQISFKQLLDVYFLVAHDPTQRDRQGPDEGTQYRSEIFYATPEQHREAVAYIAHLEASRLYSAPIVTQLAPLHAFYAAEAYHQDFAAHNPDNPYIAINDLPKLRALRKQYPTLVKADAPKV